MLGRYLAGFEGGCVAAVFAIVGHMAAVFWLSGRQGHCLHGGGHRGAVSHPAGAAGNPVGGAGAVQPMHFAWFHNSCAGADPGGSAVVPWAGGGAGISRRGRRGDDVILWAHREHGGGWPAGEENKIYGGLEIRGAGQFRRQQTGTRARRRCAAGGQAAPPPPGREQKQQNFAGSGK